MKVAAVCCVVGLALVCGALVPVSAASGGSVWHGFSYLWLHHVLGFETPHRLGSFANYLYDDQLSTTASQWCVDSDYHMELTPGVDGDYAHPETTFSALYDPSGRVSVASLETEFQFFDNSTGGSVPHADTSLVHNFVANVTADAGFVASNYEVVLAGFNVQMKCVGSGCNSNGAWVYNLGLSLNDCTPGVGGLQCSLNVDLGRGWTPSHGGGKPYNDRMEFAFVVYYKVVSGPTDLVSFVRDAPVKTNSNIFAGASSGTQQLAGPTSGYTSFIPGMRGFSWDLTGHYANRGRYMEGLGFQLSNGDDAWSYKWSAEFLSPKITTYASNVAYSIQATVMGFAPSVDVVSKTASGSVCEDDPSSLFKCKSVHLPADLQDTVKVSACGTL